MRVKKLFLESCFDDLNILIIGDVILDHYLVGKVDRISPEAPVPVVLHEEEDYRLGGAANVALNIKAMGATPYLVSLIGEDLYADKFVSLLDQLAIESAYLTKDSNRVTTCKTRILARNQHLLRYDHETTASIDVVIQQKVLKKVQTLIQHNKIDAILFQDYNKGLLTTTLISNILALAQDYDIPTLADPKKTNFLAYHGVTWFKPNLREINEGLGLSISEKEPNVDDLLSAMQQLKKHLGNRHALITLGAKGMYYSGIKKTELVPTKIRQIADVCGAGDTVISIVALGVAAQLEPTVIVNLANIAGGQVCEKVGVVPINKIALLKEYFDCFDAF